MQQQQGLESGSQEPSILGQFWQPGAISQLARVGAFRPQAYRESSSAECSDKTESLTDARYMRQAMRTLLEHAISI
jgi:hypothetical protein